MTDQVILKGWTFSQVPIWATCDERISDKAARVMAYLVWRQGTNPTCWPSQDRIAQDMHCSGQTIHRAIQELEENGYVIVTPRPGRSNHYTVVAQPEGAAQYYPDETTPIKNDTPPLSKMIGAPIKNDTHNDSKEREKETIVSASALAGAFPDSNGIYTAEMELMSDEQVACTACQEPVVVERQPNSGGTCPHCGVGLRIVHNGRTIKKGKRRIQTLGGLFDDAPTWAKPIKIPKPTLAADAEALHDADRETFWNCVKWAQDKVADGNMNPHALVGAAVGWCRKRLRNTDHEYDGTIDLTPPEQEGTLVIPEW